MHRKLTLSVDESVIKQAKTHASERKISLSNLVENYLRLLTSTAKTEKDEYSKTVSELIGSVPVSDDFDYEQEKYEYLREKYLNDKAVH